MKKESQGIKIGRGAADTNPSTWLPYKGAASTWLLRSSLLKPSRCSLSSSSLSISLSFLRPRSRLWSEFFFELNSGQAIYVWRKSELISRMLAQCYLFISICPSFTFYTIWFLLFHLCSISLRIKLLDLGYDHSSVLYQKLFYFCSFLIYISLLFWLLFLLVYLFKLKLLRLKICVWSCIKKNFFFFFLSSSLAMISCWYISYGIELHNLTLTWSCVRNPNSRRRPAQELHYRSVLFYTFYHGWPWQKCCSWVWDTRPNWRRRLRQSIWKRICRGERDKS